MIQSSRLQFTSFFDSFHKIFRSD
jgi:hypothetical protein